MYLYDDYELNLLTLKDDLKDGSDFLLKEIFTGNNKALVCAMDGLIDSLQLSQMIMKPLLDCNKEFSSPREQLEFIKTKAVHCIEQNSVETFEDAYYFLMSGFAVVIIDGCNEGLAFGIQLDEKNNLRS